LFLLRLKDPGGILPIPFIPRQPFLIFCSRADSHADPSRIFESLLVLEKVGPYSRVSFLYSETILILLRFSIGFSLLGYAPQTAG